MNKGRYVNYFKHITAAVITVCAATGSYDWRFTWSTRYTGGRLYDGLKCIEVRLKVCQIFGPDW